MTPTISDYVMAYWGPAALVVIVACLARLTYFVIVENGGRP